MERPVALALTPGRTDRQTALAATVKVRAPLSYCTDTSKMARPHLAVLLVCLLRAFSAARAAPLSRESVIMRAKVKLNAEQLVIRLNIYLTQRFPSGLSLSPPNDPLDGLSSLVLVLGGYESLLSERLEGLTQARQDVSSLRGYLDHWREDHCSEQSRRHKQPLQGRLAQLQSHKEFVQTVGIEAAKGLKVYLGHLLKNMDYLGTC